MACEAGQSKVFKLQFKKGTLSQIYVVTWIVVYLQQKWKKPIFLYIVCCQNGCSTKKGICHICVYCRPTVNSKNHQVNIFVCWFFCIYSIKGPLACLRCVNWRPNRKMDITLTIIPSKDILRVCIMQINVLSTTWWWKITFWRSVLRCLNRDVFNLVQWRNMCIHKPFFANYNILIL